MRSILVFVLCRRLNWIEDYNSKNGRFVFVCVYGNLDREPSTVLITTSAYFHLHYRNMSVQYVAISKSGEYDNF